MVYGLKIFKGKDGGFTVLEVLISITVLSIALIALASLATQGMRATETGKRLTQALNIGTEKLESLKAIPYANIQSDGNDGGITRDCALTGSPPPLYTCTPSPAAVSPDSVMYFTWYWTVEYIDLDSDTVYYSTDPIIDSNDIKKVTVVVQWTDLFGPHTVTLPLLRSKV